MSMMDFEEAKKMRECFKKIGGREGVSKRVAMLCVAIVETDSYDLIAMAMGRIARLSDVASRNKRWIKKMRQGHSLEYGSVVRASMNGGVFDKFLEAMAAEKL